MKHDGGPAFPDPGRGQSEKQREKLGNPGMALRDYFAAKAMTICELPTFFADGTTAAPLGDWASKAYRLADAMLAAREK